MASFEIEPVREYPDGSKFYFGTFDNPFNFYKVGGGPIISADAEALIADGGRPKLRAVPEDQPADGWRERVERQNREEISRRLGKLPLDSSDQQSPSEHRPAA